MSNIKNFMMKTKLLLFLSIALLLSCTNQESESLSSVDEFYVKNEIKKHLDVVAEDFKNLNFDKTWSFTDSTEYLFFITTKGTILNYQEEVNASKNISNYYNKCLDYNYVINDINILSFDIAILTITYNVKFVDKNDNVENHPKTVGTALYKKINGDWKCISWHDSSSGTEIEKPK